MRYILFTFLVFISIDIIGQINNTNGLIYHENNELVYESGSKKEVIGTNLYVSSDDLPIKNRRLNYFDSTPAQVKITEGYVLYSAVQSPFDDSWIYMEIELRADNWNLWIYRDETKAHELLYTENSSPVPDMGLAPFGFIKENKVLLEANQLNLSTDFQGIWELDIPTKKISKINISSSYLGTPVVSLDGKSMAYTTSSEFPKDILHGKRDELWLMNTASKNTSKIKDGKEYKLIGWTNRDRKNLKTTDHYIQKKNKSIVSEFKMPFPEGTTYYVTRAGLPITPGGPGNGVAGCFNLTGSLHSRPAHDFSNRSLVNGQELMEEFSAATDGEVHFAGIGDPGGFGAFIRILMPDGNFCYYGHCSSWFVNVGDCVVQGQIIGREGDLGSSTAEHLHLEFRGPSRDPATAYYLPMEDCGGCVPHTNYCYTSTNKVTECGACIETLALNASSSVSTDNTKEYQAERCISLEPGFDGANGSVVDLQIVPCDNQLTNTSNN